MSFYKMTKGNVFETHLKGRALLQTPMLNKGTAFTAEERQKFELAGLLPATIESMDLQLKRAYQSYKKKTTDLGRHIFLRDLQDRDETLFYRLLSDHITEMLPIVYTPVVGLACQSFHEIYRHPRGLFIAYTEQDQLDAMMANIQLPDVKVIVVSDGERILGLGDQGVGGMGIPIGKTTLYSACGGIFPGYTLPIILDVGTDNEERLKDPLYLGWRHKRIRGKEYDDFIDRFVKAVLKHYPNVLLQWEDFAKDHARDLLERYKDKLCTFNDDIQGTAAVALAGILAALKVNKTDFHKQQVVIYGAGSAGTGIADEIVRGMMRQGLELELARHQIWMIDRNGLIHSGTSHLSSFQIPYAQPKQIVSSLGMDPSRDISLEDVVEKVRPTILIGVSGAANVFSEKAIRTMARYVDRPIIFPLSNPTANCEAHPADVIKWTEGKALIATGTQFPSVEYNGKTYKIGQCNNYYIFPAMGLAVLASKAHRVTDAMFLAAAEGLSVLSPALKNPAEPLFPEPDQVRDIAKKLAFAVALQAEKDKVAPLMKPDDLRKAIEENFWEPKYHPITPLA
jgi:malate dehydrogenase (oxaloacetate-decarboxylating)